jgi:translocation and assembly module TamA
MSQILRFFWILLLSAIALVQIGLAPTVAAQDKVRTTPLRFTVKDALREDIQAISLLAKILTEPDHSDAEILAAAKADYQRIVLTLYESGYYSSSINIRINGREVADYSLFDKIGTINSAAILVNEGPVFLFGTAQITPLPAAAELPDAFTTGQVAKVSVIGDAADKAIRDWQENSHPKAEITNQNLIADHKAAMLDVRLQIDPGRKAKFGTLKITGNQRMRTNRILKIAGMPTGDYYTSTQLNKSADRLRATGIFSSVVFTEADTISPDGFLDITANVTEAKLRRIGVDATVSTDEGATLKAFWLHRNLFGGGEQLRFDADISGIAGETGGEDFEIGTTLIRPATLTPDTTGILYITYAQDVEPNYTLQEFSTGLTFDHRFSETLTGFAGIKYSNIDTDDAFGQRNFSLIGLPMGLIYDTRNNKFAANEGIFMALDVSPFLDLKRSHSGAHVTFDGRTYKGFGAQKNIVLAGRLQLGSVIGPDLQDLPSNFLFYSGGGDTVRGQDFQSLGIILPSGLTVGGKSFIGLSAELRALISKKIGGVIFADYGYIGAKSAFGVDGDSHAGAGIGLWYETPIGPIRFDLAVPTDSGVKLSNINAYIGIGHAF